MERDRWYRDAPHPEYIDFQPVEEEEVLDECDDDKDPFDTSAFDHLTKVCE